jgi:hypothetical protein
MLMDSYSRARSVMSEIYLSVALRNQGYTIVYGLDFDLIYSYINPYDLYSDNAYLINQIINNKFNKFVLLPGTIQELVHFWKDIEVRIIDIESVLSKLKEDYQTPATLDAARQIIESQNSRFGQSGTNVKINFDSLTKTLIQCLGIYSTSTKRIEDLLYSENLFSLDIVFTSDFSKIYSENIQIELNNRMSAFRTGRRYVYPNQNDSTNLASIINYYNECDLDKTKIVFRFLSGTKILKEIEKAFTYKADSFFKHKAVELRVPIYEHISSFTLTEAFITYWENKVIQIFNGELNLTLKFIIQVLRVLNNYYPYSSDKNMQMQIYKALIPKEKELALYNVQELWIFSKHVTRFLFSSHPHGLEKQDKISLITRLIDLYDKNIDYRDTLRNFSFENKVNLDSNVQQITTDQLDKNKNFLEKIGLKFTNSKIGSNGILTKIQKNLDTILAYQRIDSNNSIYIWHNKTTTDLLRDLVNFINDSLDILKVSGEIRLVFEDSDEQLLIQEFPVKNRLNPDRVLIKFLKAVDKTHKVPKEIILDSQLILISIETVKTIEKSNLEIYIDYVESFLNKPLVRYLINSLDLYNLIFNELKNSIDLKEVASKPLHLVTDKISDIFIN